MRFLLFFCLIFCLASPVFSQKKQTATAAPAPKTGFDENLFNALEWRCLGPFRGGRSAAVTGVPD